MTHSYACMQEFKNEGFDWMHVMVKSLQELTMNVDKWQYSNYSVGQGQSHIDAMIICTSR